MLVCVCVCWVVSLGLSLPRRGAAKLVESSPLLSIDDVVMIVTPCNPADPLTKSGTTNTRKRPRYGGTIPPYGSSLSIHTTTSILCIHFSPYHNTTIFPIILNAPLTRRISRSGGHLGEPLGLG